MSKKNLIIPICLGMVTGVTIRLIQERNKNIKRENLKKEIVYSVYENDGETLCDVTREDLDRYITNDIPVKESYKIPVLRRNPIIDAALIDNKKVVLKPNNGRINCYFRLDETDEYFGAFNDKQLTLYLKANEKNLEANIIGVISLVEGEKFIEIIPNKK